MSREAMYRIHNPRFSVNSSREGADRLAKDLVVLVVKSDTDPHLVIEVLRGQAGEAVESARKFVERAAESHKRNNGWAKLAMSSARGYLIAARAVQLAVPARAVQRAIPA